MTEPEKKPDLPGTVPPAETQSADAPVVEEKTQPYSLLPQVEKLARKRRRTTAAELLVKRPWRPEVRVPLDRDETFIGRDPTCDIVLTDETASRRHARIARNTGGYFEIVDLASRNGLLSENERVGRMTLLDGDTFMIGETQFVVVVGPLLGAEP